ncbi:MAG TPA: hypothetical protein VF131_02075 [Blastocatellia bacterium]|nr:hypothetical protein [Blastocatellia bacterium]
MRRKSIIIVSILVVIVVIVIGISLDIVKADTMKDRVSSAQPDTVVKKEMVANRVLRKDVSVKVVPGANLTEVPEFEVGQEKVLPQNRLYVVHCTVSRAEFLLTC